MNTITGHDARMKRIKLGLNQTDFWRPLGITQSGASRYESGRSIPRPVQMLLRIAYGAKAQAAKQVEALRPGADQEAAS